MADKEQMIFNTLVQISNTLTLMLRLMEDQKRNGVNVRTQESHSP